MSWTDTILSNTVGVAFRAATGNVDDQATLRLPIIGTLDLPKIQKLVDGVLIVAAVGSVIYFGVLYHKTLGREFRKLKEGR